MIRFLVSYEDQQSSDLWRFVTFSDFWPRQEKSSDLPAPGWRISRMIKKKALYFWASCLMGHRLRKRA